MEEFKEKCAVVGVFNSSSTLSLCYYSLFAMQHRGQEGSGIVLNDGTNFRQIDGRGLVNEVYSKERLDALSSFKAFSAIAHNSYANKYLGTASIEPVIFSSKYGELALAHNGEIHNLDELNELILKRLNGASKGGGGSVEIKGGDALKCIFMLLETSSEELIEDALVQSLRLLDGPFALVALTKDKLMAARDHKGLRPLCLGSLDGASIICSESCAFSLSGITFIRDIEAGEMLVVSKDALPLSINIKEANKQHPLFEFIYFARPDSVIDGMSVYETRKNMGVELAREVKSQLGGISADVIVPIPDSGVVSALGYASSSKIPLEFALVRHHYVGRSFIQPTQELRELTVRLKISPVKEVIEGKDLIVIDDSIVRGTTAKQIIKILRLSGARKIHFLVSSPSSIVASYYGIDKESRHKLISASKSVEEVREFIGADSLHFLSIEGLQKALVTSKAIINKDAGSVQQGAKGQLGEAAG